MAEVLIKLRDLPNSFSQAEASGDAFSCPDLESWEEMDEKDFGCSTEVCVDKHTLNSEGQGL